MKKYFLKTVLITGVFFSSCTQSSKQKAAQTELPGNAPTEIVEISSTNKDGKKLEMSFNNTRGTATLNFEGETIELIAQKSASGFWYKNEDYELRGKGNDIELRKKDTLIFMHKDEIVRSSLTNEKGQTLDITFNKTTNTAKVYLNGGRQIDLMGQNPASGIWYKNDQYELRGKGESVELTKDGKIVFKN